MAFSNVNPMDFLAADIKCEVDEECLYPGPSSLQSFCADAPLCSDTSTSETGPFYSDPSQQGEFYHNITVKEEPMFSKEGEEDGQFVLEDEEVMEPEVDQDSSEEDFGPKKAVWLSTTPGTSSIPGQLGKCHICIREFYDINKHYASTHGSFWTKIARDSQSLQCPVKYCKIIVQDLNELSSHLGLVHYKPVCLKCPLCSETYKNNRELQRHIAYKHCIERTPRMNTHDSMTQCSICKQYFENISNHLVEKHNATKSAYHCNGITFHIVWTYCPVCQKHYSGIRGVRKHIQCCHAKKKK